MFQDSKLVIVTTVTIPLAWSMDHGYMLCSN